LRYDQLKLGLAKGIGIAPDQFCSGHIRFDGAEREVVTGPSLRSDDLALEARFEFGLLAREAGMLLMRV